ncbi:MAG: hypothetical protein ABI670_03055 [Chloroflexota bacterium]
MANYDETYERTVAKLLTENLEQGIPDDADVWSRIEHRLAQRESAAPIIPAGARGWWQRITPLLATTGAAVSSGNRRIMKARPYITFATGVVGFALLALITTITISRFARQVAAPPIPLPTTLSDTIFTIPVDEANIHWRTDNWVGTTGIAVAPDGTFWIGDADRRHLHYSNTGTLLGTQSYAGSKVQPFFTMQDDHLWVYESMPSPSDPSRITTGFFKVMYPNGNFFGGLTWESDGTDPYQGAPSVLSGTQSISLVAGITSLQIGGDGQLIVETTPLNDKNRPDYARSYLIQAVDASGKPDLKLLPGYPAGGKYYTTGVARDAKSGYVTNGDIRVEITSTLYIRRLDVRGVRPDGSFYVISEERVTPAVNANGGEIDSPTLNANYIYHYSASGKLIERARIPGDFTPHIDVARRLAQSGDGTFYWLGTVFPPQGPEPTSVEVQRINFFPADKPLPGAAPASTPAPLPTVPALAGWGDNTYIFTVQQGNEEQRYDYHNGFAVAADGTFWLGRQGGLEHYSAEGKLLDKNEMAVTDLEATGSNIWAASSNYIFKMALDGSIEDVYDPLKGSRYLDSTSVNLMLKAGQDGEMLIGWNEGSYLKVVGQHVNPTPDGSPNPPPIPGYPANGKFYRINSGNPDIIAGDLALNIGLLTAVGVDEHRSLLGILKVETDGSFYVTVQASPAQATMPYSAAHLYVLHFSADGRLIDRARVSTDGQFYTNATLIAPGPDGAFYAVGMPAYLPSTPPGKVGVARLNFVPAAESLPPVPTPIPTPVLPTPVPTAESVVPLPTQTGTK